MLGFVPQPNLQLMLILGLKTRPRHYPFHYPFLSFSTLVKRSGYYHYQEMMNFTPQLKFLLVVMIAIANYSAKKGEG
ncbi:MAG: hypothetical protein QNJ63_24310 [Calothrix sp. MO_192.B10]|nr:hypothetical protein [Calothrix sp. MO_192.B10]